FPHSSVISPGGAGDGINLSAVLGPYGAHHQASHGISPSSMNNPSPLSQPSRQPPPRPDPSPASTSSQVPFISPAPFRMPEPQPANTLTVGHAPSRVPDIDDMTGSTNHIATVINSDMSIPDIITNLGQHGCCDVGCQLDLASCTTRPMSRGGFSDVYLGKLYDGTPVAVKTIFILSDAQDQERKHLKRTARELYTWSKCKHPNIVRLLGLAEFRDQIAMVSPWMENGDLRTYIKRCPSVNRFELCIQIADGLAYLHSIGITHCDLKGPNVLISKAGTATLIDFGNAILAESALQFTRTMTSHGLTARWTAPEILAGGKHNTASDVYALGMVCCTVSVFDDMLIYFVL
ncbi:hypothetical protein FS749_012632, partial [Ceratobasidium sp. UAMH 11750]